MKDEKVLQQGEVIRVTKGEAAKLEEIIEQIDVLEKKRNLWWEKQLNLAGVPEGTYQFLPTEGVIIRTK